jgi:hypothetical protein
MSKSKIRKLNKYRKIYKSFYVWQLQRDTPLAKYRLGGNWGEIYSDDFKGFSLSPKPLSDVNPTMPRHCLEFVV